MAKATMVVTPDLATASEYLNKFLLADDIETYILYPKLYICVVFMLIPQTYLRTARYLPNAIEVIKYVSKVNRTALMGSKYLCKYVWKLE